MPNHSHSVLLVCTRLAMQIGGEVLGCGSTSTGQGLGRAGQAFGGAGSGQGKAEVHAVQIWLLTAPRVGREKGRMPSSLNSPCELSAGLQTESWVAHLCVEAGPPCASCLLCV